MPNFFFDLARYPTSMVFSSVTFLLYFLPIFFLIYYLRPFRNATLLMASLVFYAWGELENLWILLVSIAGDYP